MVEEYIYKGTLLLDYVASKAMSLISMCTHNQKQIVNIRNDV